MCLAATPVGVEWRRASGGQCGEQDDRQPRAEEASDRQSGVRAALHGSFADAPNGAGASPGQFRLQGASVNERAEEGYGDAVRGCHFAVRVHYQVDSSCL